MRDHRHLLRAPGTGRTHLIMKPDYVSEPVGADGSLSFIGDAKWTHRLASIPNPFSLEIRAFDEAEEYDAWDWASS